jgi:site-specific recombinase XerD
MISINHPNNKIRRQWFMDINKQNMKSLIEICEQELYDREYGLYLHRKISACWNKIALWMEKNGLLNFTQEVGRRYCLETFGSEVLQGIEKQDRLEFRAIRMLISYQRDGYFEFRAPLIAQRVFQGETGNLMESFFEHLCHTKQHKNTTIEQKRLRLYEFNTYLNISGICLKNVTTYTLTNFCVNQSYSLGKKHFFNSTIRQFLRYAYDVGETASDLSFMVMPDNYKSYRKLPTTYEEEEIRKMLLAVERASAIGKRDYLVLLLAAEYGWRSSDIVDFSFSHINWDKNTISFDQQKTGSAVQYPLLSSVGNAIIDYLKNGRPDTNAQEIIVAHDMLNRGKKLKTPTIHSIVTRYLRTAGIENWQKKKHGPHSLRHSLATNLLKKNVSMPIIAVVLGHQSTESTKLYLTLDIEQLRKCALPMPVLGTGIFEVIV